MSSSLARIIWCLPVLAGLSLTAAPAESPPESAPHYERREGTITVNVFGAAEKPGSYQLSPNSTLLDALGAAGGWKPTATLKKVSILSGPAGKKPDVAIYDVDAILHGTAPNPEVRGHDSVFIPDRMF